MTAAVQGEAADWRRLDRRMMLVHPVTELVRFVPAVVGVSVVGGGAGWWQALTVAAPIALGLLRYATTRFRVAGGQLELQHGLIRRTLLTAPLDRIRTVELRATPIHRVLGLASVEIGTGAHDSDALRLDALARPSAQRMRRELLHRADPGAREGGDGSEDTEDTVDSVDTAQDRAASADVVMLRLRLGWVRYAPLSTSTLLVALGAVAAVSHSAGTVLDRVVHRADLRALRAVGPSALVSIGLLVALAAVAVLAMLGYVLVNAGFVLSRDRWGRSYHVRRGLLTTRETSLDTHRLRGVELHEPLTLRLAGAAELAAVVTGLRRREAASALLVPPAPRSAALAVGATVLGSPDALTQPLRSHGPVAIRRRWTRALGAGVPLAGAYGVAAWLLGLHVLALVGAVLGVAVAAGLAHDRARRLGHALTPTHLVLRTHSVVGCRTVLERSGVIGWNLRQSFFQRRAGVVTMVATTAARRGRYRLPDVPEAVAAALVAEVCGEPVAPFLAELRRAGGTAPSARAS